MATMKPDVLASAAVAAKEQSFFVKVIRGVPLFLYLLVFFMVIKWSVLDVRDVVLTLGGYSLAWVEVLYLFAAMIAMCELLRVSRPGIDNTKESLFMLGATMMYVVLFALGAAQVSFFEQLFNNTEYLVLTLISIVQTILAFLINARTLKRTIDYTGNE